MVEVNVIICILFMFIDISMYGVLNLLFKLFDLMEIILVIWYKGCGTGIIFVKFFTESVVRIRYLKLDILIFVLFKKLMIIL